MSVFIVCIIVTLLFTLPNIRADAVPCSGRKFDSDSVVCECNATYCDAVGRETELLYSYFNAFVTTRDGLRMDRQLGSWDDQIEPNEYVYTVGNVTYQTIMGFGGAFTDAATTTISKLSLQTKIKLINSYFEENGIEYTLGRIPMASSDFSERIYSYDDADGDLSLSEFVLQPEDLVRKIPLIKQALAISKRNISFFGSPWSSPPWMKSNNNMTGKGTLKGDQDGPYYKAWAQYFVKFLQAYKQQGVDMWGLTIQNEPNNGLQDGFPYQCLGWTAEMQRDFIKQHLGPSLEEEGFGQVKLMILDDQRLYLPTWAQVILRDPEAAKYVAGIAVHWYEDLEVPVTVIDDTYKEFGKDFFIMNTEATVRNEENKSASVQLGHWASAERYFSDMIQDLNHSMIAWVDLNIALDISGGPNWQGNYADSPIIVDTKRDLFYKQPSFYAMGHFSKFFRPGSKVIEHHLNGTSHPDVEAIFVYRKDNSIAASFLNKNATSGVDITIMDHMVSGYLNFELPPKSFVTFVWGRI